MNDEEKARRVSKTLDAKRGALREERAVLKNLLFVSRYSARVRTDHDPSVNPGAVEEMEARFKQIDEELARLDKED